MAFDKKIEELWLTDNKGKYFFDNFRLVPFEHTYDKGHYIVHYRHEEQDESSYFFVDADNPIHACKKVINEYKQFKQEKLKEKS